MKKRMWLIALVLLGGLLIPRQVRAETYEISTMEAFKTKVEDAQDGDIIDITGLLETTKYSHTDFYGTVDRYKIVDGKNTTINVKSNIKITAEIPNKNNAQSSGSYVNTTNLYGNTDLESEINLNPKNVYALVIKDINFNIESQKNLEIDGELWFIGKKDEPVVFGNGNLKLAKGRIDARTAQDAISLPNGKVTVVAPENDVNRAPLVSKINAGKSVDTNGGRAIYAKEVDVFIDRNNNYEIRAGNSTNGNGGFAIEGETVKVDLSKYSGTYYYGGQNKHIIGGSGKYPGGAILGKYLDIKAGNKNIFPGEGTDTIVGQKYIDSQQYHGVIEVMDDGHLSFGENVEKFDQSYIVGFDRSACLGPTILAKGSASVNIYGGRITGTGPNYLSSMQDSEKFLQPPVIQMGTGKLQVLKNDGGSAPEIFGGNHIFNTSEAIVKTEGEVYVSGEGTIIAGPSFTIVSGGGYNKNELARKMGSAGILSTGNITIDNKAIVAGGYLYNITEILDNELLEYRSGSGIVGNGENSVIVKNGAIVQGAGYFQYGPEMKIEYKSRGRKNLNTGHGIENVKNVLVEGGEVHGGDVVVFPNSCSTDCNGVGHAGDGIHLAQYVNLKDSEKGEKSIITGGGTGNNKYLLGKAYGGSGIVTGENGVVEVGGNSLVAGGDTGLDAGHGIVGAKTVTLTENATVQGGASRQQKSDASSGTGIKATDVFVYGGKLEAGYTPWLNLVDKYKSALHTQLLNNDFMGDSEKAVAIDASGKVIIDGKSQSSPEVKSHYYKQSFGNLSAAPIVRLEDGAYLLVGNGNLEAGHPEANLVEGGSYHVDIFKNNTINTVTDNKDESISYNDNSIGLYRVLDKDSLVSNPTDLAIEVEPITVFDGYKLYAESNTFNKSLNQLAKIRKNTEQNTYISLDDTNEINKMPSDNISVAKPIKPEIPKDEKITIVFNENYPEGKIFTESIKKGDSLDDKFPQDPKREGYIFKGWEDKDGNRYNASTKIHQDLEVFAIWEKMEKEILIPDWLISGPGENINIEVHKAYIKGYPEGDIQAEGNMTRAEAVTVLARLEKLNLNDESATVFADANDWFNKYINAAYKAGWLEEKAGENFRPNDKITRAELAQLISHIDEKVSTTTAPFEDVKGHVFEAAINKAYGNGRILGYPDGTFKPDNAITRAEVATMLNRLYDRKVDREGLRHAINLDDLTKFTDLMNAHWAYYEIMEAANSHEYTRRYPNELVENWIEIFKK